MFDSLNHSYRYLWSEVLLNDIIFNISSRGRCDWSIRTNTKWCGVSIDTVEEGIKPVLLASTCQASIVAFENPLLRIFAEYLRIQFWRIFAMHCGYACETDVPVKIER